MDNNQDYQQPQQPNYPPQQPNYQQQQPNYQPQQPNYQPQQPNYQQQQPNYQPQQPNYQPQQPNYQPQQPNYQPQQPNYQPQQPNYQPQYQQSIYGPQYPLGGNQDLMPHPWLTEAIVLTVLSATICCNLISLVLGIIGIVKANEVKNKFFAGDIEGANSSSNSAKILVIIGGIWMLVSIIIGIIIYFTAPELLMFML